MFHTAVRTAAIAIAALVGVTVVGVGSASADLRPQDAIIVSSWSGQLYSVDATTGASTPVGSPPVDNFRFAAIDIDGATGEGFAVSYESDARLYRISQSGTAPVLIGSITADGGAVGYCTGLDVTDGILWITCDNKGAENYITGSVDPTTAVMTPLVSETDRFSALATDPTTGTLYGLSYSGVAWAIDKTSGAVSEVGDFGSNGFSIYGADFDADGVLWAAGYSYANPEIPGPALLRFSTADWSGIGVGPLVEGDISLDSPESLTVVSGPETVTPAAPLVPTLPAMGSGLNLLLIGVAGGGVLLGALLLMRRRRPI